MELVVEYLKNNKVKITCPDGMVLDTRNKKAYSSVRCDEKLLRYFVASE